LTRPAYYNDNDPRACAWLRELIADGLIPPGDVDERSILDVTAADLAGYEQCHFFAGIGGWPLALQLAGWSGPVWTGSCPCQPFSCAGKRQGEADERHLWPEFRRLIAERNPPAVFGEQVASKDGRLWLAGVRADLEALGYAVGAADLCAAGIGAPHIRQRLFWVAESCGRGTGSSNRGDSSQRRAAMDAGAEGIRQEDRADAGDGPDARGAVCRLADAANPDGRRGEQGEKARAGQDRERRRGFTGSGEACGLGNSSIEGSRGLPIRARGSQQAAADALGRGEVGFWSHSVWLPCSDGRARRIEPTIFPLADGIPGRVGLLRGAGNAIVPEVAAEFIKAYMEVQP
jgi:DNA (cytosine-5)-methyltransferase 1